VLGEAKRALEQGNRAMDAAWGRSSASHRLARDLPPGRRRASPSGEPAEPTATTPPRLSRDAEYVDVDAKPTN
jgi:hypothetical protein